MKKLIIGIMLVLSINLFATKYAGEIFSMGAGVKNFALGNTGLTNPSSSALAYWNPALLGYSNNQVELMHAEEFNGLLKFDSFSAILGRNNAYSFVITRIAVNDIPLTKWDDDYDRPYEYKSVSTSDIIAYFGFKSTFKGINVGFSPKVAYRKLAENTGFGFGADIATYYKFLDNWSFAAKIKDFFTTQIFWSDSERETVFPSIILENKYSFLTPIVKKKVTLYASTDVLFEGRDYSATVNLGKMSFDFHSGLQIDINKNFSLLMGYDIQNLTAGMSLNLGKFDLNYSFEQNSQLKNSHRISIGYKL